MTNLGYNETDSVYLACVSRSSLHAELMRKVTWNIQQGGDSADQTPTLWAGILQIDSIYNSTKYEVSVNINLLLQMMPEVKEHPQGYLVGMN